LTLCFLAECARALKWIGHCPDICKNAVMTGIATDPKHFTKAVTELGEKRPVVTTQAIFNDRGARPAWLDRMDTLVASIDRIVRLQLRDTE
jgi:hypothetical protein